MNSGSVSWLIKLLRIMAGVAVDRKIINLESKSLRNMGEDLKGRIMNRVREIGQNGKPS